MNSPCSTTPGIGDSACARRSGSGDGAESAVENVMAPVSDEGRGCAAQADRAGEAEIRESALDMAPCRREAERDDLDRQRKGAETGHEFARVGDHRHAPRGRGDDLLAQERAAAALDQPAARDRSRPRRRLSDRVRAARRASRAGCRALLPAPRSPPRSPRSGCRDRPRPSRRRDRRNAGRSCRCRGRASCRA